VDHRLLGTVEIVGTGGAARRNFDSLEQHLLAEEVGDIETTMATMTASPFWINHGTETYLRGYDAVRTRYSNRFREQPGMHVDIRRTIVTETVAVLQGFVNRPAGQDRWIPLLLWVEFQDGKLAGERSYSNPAEEPGRQLG
jgi:hypothetical protein